MTARTASLVAVAAVVAALAGACAGTRQPQVARMEPVAWEEVDRADGATLYRNLCASCHGVEGRGDGPVAEALVVPMPDLTRLAAVHDGDFPMDRVEEAIRGTGILSHGGAEMPVWGPALMAVRDDWPEPHRRAFTANRIRRLAEHVRTLQRSGA